MNGRELNRIDLGNKRIQPFVAFNW